MSTEFYWIAVVVTTIISASRLTRLAVADKFPPAVWVREKWAVLTVDTGWIWLFYCGYCFSFWASVLVVGTGLWAGVYDPSVDTREFWPATWWIVNGTLATAYLAAVFMAHDGDDSNDEDDD